ncbi:ATP-binding protein [Halalkalibacter okhensis]|uniref:ATP-binding protein n=1 Tax=Halalkalibacter okhensis TaxID=333138 RepID=UPI00068C5592|nr:ATP-binding protein [Halalkalibacter okhensis]
MSSKDFEFTSSLRLSSGSHVLYSYRQLDAYVNNAVSFIQEGQNKDQLVVFIDSKVHLDKIISKLTLDNDSNERFKQILFLDSDLYYNFQDGVEDLFENYRKYIKPYLRETKPARIWGNINGKINEDKLDLLNMYECACNEFLDNKIATIMVCAYNSQTLSAYMLEDLLYCHEYFMTDTSLVPSNLYNRNQKSVAFPSISEQVKREKETEKLVIRSEKLSLTGQFAAGIAHEIRNPLTSIKGFFQLIKESNNKEIYYKIIEEELDKIEHVSNEMLILAKPHSESRHWYEVLTLINDVKMLLETQAILKNISIRTEFKTDDLQINCEDTKIKQVLINLIKNAIEVMDEGTITITARKTNSRAILSVTDEGPGISKENLEKIGEPFYTTKPKGTGIGLLVCQKIIESHQGLLSIESQEGVGTTFTIELPLHA